MARPRPKSLPTLLLAFYHATQRGDDTSDLSRDIDRALVPVHVTTQLNAAARRRSIVRSLAGLDYHSVRRYLRKKKISWHTVYTWQEWDMLNIPKPRGKRKVRGIPDLPDSPVLQGDPQLPVIHSSDSPDVKTSHHPWELID